MLATEWRFVIKYGYQPRMSDMHNDLKMYNKVDAEMGRTDIVKVTVGWVKLYMGVTRNALYLGYFQKRGII